MNQAEMLLNGLSPDEITEYAEASGNEPHVIVGADRVVVVPDQLKRIAVQHDHNVETVTFDCPRYWDGLDMSVMKIYINYARPDGGLGAYYCNTVTVDESDDTIMHFDWVVSRNVTSATGTLSFLICIKKTDANGNEENHWNSELNTDMHISKGLETSETVIAPHPDIVTQLLTRMDVVEALATEEAMQGYVNEYLDNATPLIDETLSQSGVAADAKVTGDSIADVKNAVVTKVDNLVLTTGKYIYNTGNIGTSSAFAYSEPIAIPAGCVVRLKTGGEGTAVAMISQYKADGTYVPLVICEVGKNVYEYVTKFDISLVFSVKIADGYELTIGRITEKMADDIKSLTNMLRVPISEADLLFTTGKYIYNTGAVGTSSALAYSEPVLVPAGCMVKLTASGDGTAVAMISQYKSDGTYIPLVISAEGKNVYEYVTKVPISLVFSIKIANGCKLTITHIADRIANNIKALQDMLRVPISEDDLNFTTGYYINVNGNIYPSASFGYSAPVFIPAGSRIVFSGAGIATNIAMVSRYANNMYMPMVISRSDSNEEYEYITGEDGLYSFCCYISKGYTLSVTASVSKIEERVTTLEKDKLPKSYASVALFQKIGVVGDSFSSGQMHFDGQFQNRYERSWGQILARKNGATCINFSSGGLTTRSWLTASKGLPLLLSSEPQELYLLALGINDAYTLGAEYIGNITDIKEDPAQNGDTFYGNYGKIISNIKTHAPNSRIVLITLHERVESYAAFNDAIIDIANHFGIAYVVQDEDPFFMSEFYINNMVGGHPVAVVYSGMAAAIERLLERCLVEQFEYFKEVFMY